MDETPPLSGKRILVAEDEYFIADDIRRALTQAGAEVIGPAPSVQAGLSLLGEGACDVGILDLNLGGEMAFALADRLAGAGTPFLLATGYDDQAIPSRFDAVPRLSKPFNARTLVQQLGRLTDAEQAA